VVLHFLICFMDAGTIFEDEEDSGREERAYCVTCALYRLRSSRHCVFCNRCVRWYDHHCSVFGKCIGKRNLVPFWLFILISGLEMPVLIVIVISHISISS
jgi:predicted amidophosphoribosyltransferase